MRRLALRPTYLARLMPLLIGACVGNLADTPRGPAEATHRGADDATQDPNGTTNTDREGEDLSQRDLAPARVRRLTTSEIRQSLADVFFAGDLSKVGPLSEGSVAGFDNRYDDLTVYLEIYASLGTLAEQVSRDAVGGTLSTSCEARASRACAGDLVSDYGLRLYRRPLIAAEAARLLGVFDLSAPLVDTNEALIAVMQAMILSPNFLFRSELGGERDSEGVASLTAYERATALSYYLWRSTPDDALLEAAQSGALMDPAGLRSQARRLLTSPRAHVALGDFFVRWLQIDATHAARDDPSFTPELAASMQRESELFFDDLLFSPTSSYQSLWSAQSSFIDRELASVYGTTAAPSNGEHARATLPSERRGILTQPAFIVSHTPADEFSPIFLGSLVRQSILCQALPSAPAQIPELPQDPELSVREKLAAHQENPACASCHALMDPIGFTFEQFDTIGAFKPGREREPLTGAGELTGTDVDGPLTGAAALSEQLSRSAVVKSCFVANVMQYLLGRDTTFDRGRTAADRAAIAELTEGAFANGHMLDLFVELVTSQSFLSRDASLLATP